MPRATDMPPIVDISRPSPATTNPLGVKGVGEAGTTGSLAAIVHAVANAIGGDAHKLDDAADGGESLARLPANGH